MKFFVLTLFPEMIEQALGFGVVGQALGKGLVSLSCVNPRRYTMDLHQSVDDRPYGGGDGMVMMSEPLASALVEVRNQGAKGPAIYLSPRGVPFNDSRARELSTQPDLTFICGRYAGVDERFVAAHVDLELSLGDFVLSGGELAALAMMDAISRQVPGVLGNENSAVEESFREGLLEYPQFTRPREYLGMPVPEVLLTGNHNKIHEWRQSAARLTTWLRRPDLLDGAEVRLWGPPLLEWGESLSEEEWRACGFRAEDRVRLREGLGRVGR